MGEIYLEIEDFKQAEAILKDLIFIDEFDKTNRNHIEVLKIFEARKANIDFELELAERICGDNQNYPYRTSSRLTKFFQDLGFNYEHNGITRRYWVESVLKELSVEELAFIIEKGLFRKKDYKDMALRPEDKKELSPEEFLEGVLLMILSSL